MSDNFKGTQAHRFSGVDNEKFKDRPAENTTSSLLEALENGSDFLECDVMLTKDQQVIVTHSNQLKKHIDELAPNKYASNMTLEEIQQYKSGKNRKDKIPTLEEIMDIIVQKRKEGKNIRLNVEIKGTQGTKADKGPLVDKVKNVLDKYDDTNKYIMFSSFSVEDLKELQKKMPEHKRAMLFMPSLGGILHSLQKKSSRVTPDILLPKRRPSLMSLIGKQLKVYHADKKTSPYLAFTPKNVFKVMREVDVDAFHPEAYSLSVASCLIAKKKKIPVNAWFINERKPEKQTGIIKRIERWKEKYGFNINYITDFVSELNNTRDQINIDRLRKRKAQSGR